MAKTFLELGIPFPLFDAPSDQSNEYVGTGTCSLCGNEKQHCFEVSIGTAVMINCLTCGIENGLDVDDAEDVSCQQYDSLIPFPAIESDVVQACYSCLRSGKVAISKDTILGMISWEQALEGVTHGVPGLNRPDFEIVAKADNWVGARLPHADMFELLRTPTYRSIQGERWQFCCRKPMVYIGVWSREDFEQNAPDGNGQRYFEEVVQESVPGLWEDQLHDVTGIYVFRCTTCSGLTAHWDIG